MLLLAGLMLFPSSSFVQTTNKCTISLNCEYELPIPIRGSSNICPEKNDPGIVRYENFRGTLGCLRKHRSWLGRKLFELSKMIFFNLIQTFP